LPLASSFFEPISVAASLACFMALSIYSSSGIAGKKNAFMKAMLFAIRSITTGQGRSTSAAREEATVTDLATRLQMPIAVAFL